MKVLSGSAKVKLRFQLSNPLPVDSFISLNQRIAIPRFLPNSGNSPNFFIKTLEAVQVSRKKE